ncbi:MAG: hypothetical protein HS108_05495 [Planctomycetes bacterium]|nr:hypothetical protein [Planctomycetota bacterium]
MFSDCFGTREMKFGLLAAVVSAGLVLGGCSDDDKKKGGGGTAGVIYPQVPTARPTLTGMPIAINTEGGTNNGSGNAGNAGSLSISAERGRVMRDDGRSRPAIDNNILTAAALGGGSVTYAELIAVAPAQTAVTANQVVIDLYGQDFFLPSGVILDLSGAPSGIVTVRIVANNPGDYIRLDGPVNGVRTTDHSVSLALISTQSTGTAISVDGAVDLSGYNSSVTYHGGGFYAYAYGGGVIVAGAINTRGNDITTGGNQAGYGGNVSLWAQYGDVVLRPGVLHAAGGNTTAGSVGGTGGYIEVYAHPASLMPFDWGIRTNGGFGSAAGGSGGSFSLRASGPLDVFVAFDTRAGSTVVGGPSGAGGCYILGLTVQGAVVGTANGGNGATGSDGGAVSVQGESVFGLAVEATSNGGNGSSGNGGRGGRVEVYADGAVMINVLVDGQTNGGNGANNGGDAGACYCHSYAEMRNVQATFVADGGNGTGSDGGNGSQSGNDHVFGVYSGYGEAITDTTFNITSRGGSGGGTSGNGGGVYVYLGGSDRSDFTIQANLTGGNASSTGDAGIGGGLYVYGNNVTADIELSVINSGGTGTDGDAGRGGRTYFSANRGQLRLSGSVTGRGGNAAGAGAAGFGGTFVVDGNVFLLLETNNLAVDLRGGSSVAGLGGSGSSSANFGPAIEMYATQVRVNGGTFNISGGAGSTGSGNANGGAGGQLFIVNVTESIWFGADVDGRGGRGGGTGSGGQGGTALIEAAFCDVTVSGNLLFDGADLSVSAAIGGTVTLRGQANTRFVISGTISCNGGASSAAASPQGALGGNIAIGDGDEFSARFTSTAIVRANGGGPNGPAGSIVIDLAGNSGQGVIEDTGSLLQTNDGAGAPQPNIDRNQ